MSRVYLTFDVEDTINDSSFQALKTVLNLLNKAQLKGLFFITGTAALKLFDSKDVASMLAEHEIGYHSSSHSVRPTIFEFTDVPDYKEAVRASIERETSKINLLTGEIEGPGGILSLRELFPDKRITCFRSPGFCWTPPHLEALKKLGFQCDFSANLSPKKVLFKGITFYPFAKTLVPPEGTEPLKLSTYHYLLSRVFSHRMAVFDIHPQSLTTAEPWDSIYFSGNPSSLRKTQAKKTKEIQKCILDLSSFFQVLSFLQKMGMVEVTASAQPSYQTLKMTKEVFSRSFNAAMFWPTRFFNYQPKCLKSHFSVFFDYAPTSPYLSVNE